MQQHSDTGTVIPQSSAALVVADDGQVSLLLPQFSDDENVPETVLAVTALFLRLERDADFVAEQLEWMRANADD